MTKLSPKRHGSVTGLCYIAATGSIPSKTSNNTNMKIKHIICSAVAFSLLAGGLTACVTEKEEANEGKEGKANKLEAQAKITKAEAQKIALDRVPGGTIKEGEIEKEKGKLLWSFDIATPGTKDITEVQVDAMTGQVLDVSKETAADQEKEKKEDEKGEKK
jgi:uncharacterized membrane protein YkoI